MCCVVFMPDRIFSNQARMSSSFSSKGGVISESDGGFSKLPKYVPKTYLVLFNAVHSVDKVANLYLFVLKLN